MDFFKISTRSVKRGTIEIYPKFIIKSPSKDLMIKGGDFYAVWREDISLWSTDEQTVIDIVDHELDKFYEENKARYDNENVVIKHMWDSESGMIDAWHKYCQKQMRDHFTILDETLIFSNTDVKKEDYASKKLTYPLSSGKCEAYDQLMSVLYAPEERHKLEWAIGSVVTGASKTLQKFVVLYGSAGTGKSTVLNIIQDLFDGYCSVFDAKALGSSSNVFALEAFKNNPLVAIQHDGDLSRIEDNTRLNSLVSHETMTVNNKFERLYSTKFKSFLFMGTNQPVRITDAKSGLLRRLIDVSPTGEKLPVREYNKLVKQIKFELGQIAWKCKEVYEEDPEYYDSYVPINMMGASNDFFNFVNDHSLIFKNEDGVTLKAAWEMYKLYCEDAKTLFPLSKMKFKEELKSYFREFDDRYSLGDGTKAVNYYHGFRYEKFEQTEPKKKNKKIDILHMDFVEKSILDEALADCHAQYGTAKEAPAQKWTEVKTTLKDIDTGRLHYVRPPQNLIVIDFDIPDENGEKSLENNLKAAAQWPPTYAELSKSGKGVHLHYWYDGDVTELSNIFSENIEIKKFTGKAALRRCLTKCCNLDISHISSGLPLKGAKKMVNFDSVKSEKALRSLIIKNVNKEYHPGTKPSIDFIYKILEDAYNSGLKYDVSDLKTIVIDFAMGSTHQADYCLKLTNKMKWQSEEASENVSNEDTDLIFYDVEVFPNLFIVNYKRQGEGKAVMRMINPKPAEVEELMKYRLVGFNCRRYDNHILWARMMGYDNMGLYNLSMDIIGNGKGFFGEAYNVSYADIYDICAKKQSLKKWEIELGIHHLELGLPWDQPVDEAMWERVAEYCDNDVIATEAVWDANQGDVIARKILSILADGSMGDTTNQLTTRIIFGKEKKPQDQFNYRDMGDVTAIDIKKTKQMIKDAGLTGEVDSEFTKFDSLGRPVFPGYSYENNVSTYRGEEVGEGGYVYAEPNVHYLVGLDDVASMHPSSIEDEQLFGPYTFNFSAIKQTRIHIKHHEYDETKELLTALISNLYTADKVSQIIEELMPYLTDDYADALSYALKIAINSVYGLTSAKFTNPFRDPRNIDNIVAKRGALFMVNLKHEVQKRGYTVAHIKTDSIKVPYATKDILDFIDKYGKLYGYIFEHEATYEKMCLVNDAVYIAQYATPEHCEKLYGYIPGDNIKHFKKHNHPWTATGTQFQVPYVFKTLFSHEPIKFEDKCETKAVTSDLYIHMADEELKENIEAEYKFVGKVGLFCPIKPGCGGGELLRIGKDKDGNTKYSSATGCKGYNWLESEIVKELGKEKDIDESYYLKMVDDAHDAIAQYVDFDIFVDTNEVEMRDKNFEQFMNVPLGIDDEVPWGEVK